MIILFTIFEDLGMHYFIYLVLLVFFVACANSPVPFNSSEQKIYDGYAFDVYINDKKVIYKDALFQNRALKHYEGSTKNIVWTLKEPVYDEMNLKIKAIDNLTSYIGYLKPDSFEVIVFPLQKVRLNAQKREEAREDVLVNGSPMLSQINLLETTKLPSGEYLLRVKARGTQNWDRKEIYIRVENNESKSMARGVFAPFSWYTLALGKHKDSVRTLSRTLSLETSKEHEHLNQLETVQKEHRQKREFAKALLYQNKLTHYYEEQSGKESLATADMYNNKALLHQDLGEYEKALMLNQKSLEIKLKYYPKAYEAISVNYDNMGITYHAMGKYAEAIKMFKNALALREAYFPKVDVSLGDSYNNLGIAFEHIDNHKEALVNLKKALNIRQKTVGEKHVTTASVYSAMGSVYESLKAYAKAEKLHEKSIAIHEELCKNKRETEALASAYGAMGTLQHTLHKYEKAIEYYQKMLVVRDALPHLDRHLSLSEVYNNMGVSYMHLNQFKLAKRYLEKAITLKKEILGSGTTALHEEYKNLGWLYFGYQNYKKAYYYAKKSVKMILAQRDDYFSVLDALEYKHFIKNNQEQLDLLFQCTHYLGDKKSYVDTFSYWLQYKGAMLDNQNHLTRAYAHEMGKEIQKKVKKLLEHQRTLSKLYQHKMNQKNAEILALEIQEHKDEVKQLKEELSLSIKRDYIDFKALVSVLEEGQLYVDFARIGKYYFGFAVDKEGQIFFRRISRKRTQKIDTYVLSFRKEMNAVLKSHKKADNKELTELYSILLETLLERLTKNKKSLIISPDGLLRLLPFEALFSTKHQQYLVEDKSIHYIPSGREFLHLKRAKKERSLNQNINQNIVVFADPDFDGDISDERRGSNNRIFEMHFSKLKGTKEEAQSIEKIMKRVVSYKGSKATEENLLNVKQPKILHIATHGFFIKSEMSNPMLNAGIALTGANSGLKKGRGEGVITALKLSGMNLKGTELVVLSACETGLVGIYSPDSVSLLSKAFLQAGAKAIVASLWSVSDSGTKELMEHFYREIEQGFSYLEALKRAKITMIKQGIPPAIWSAFILNGDE